MPQDIKELIERDLKAALTEAGVPPESLDLALPVIKRDGIAYDDKARQLTGIDTAVAALKAEKPALFGAKSGYRDTTKALVDIERARDMERFGQSAADLY